MTAELETDLISRYQLEKQLLSLQHRADEVQEELPRCKYRLRQCQEALWGYEAFGLKSLVDKLRGNWEEKHETLQRQLRSAEAEVASRQRETEAIQAQRQQLQQSLTRLNLPEDVLEVICQLEQPRQERMLQLEARLCAEKLIPILEENGRSLELAQQWARPHNQLESVPGMTLATLLSQADELAKEAMGLLERIADCGILLDIHPYFTNPAGYINGVTQFNRLDRMNSAMNAVADGEKQARELLLQLWAPDTTQ